MTAGPISSPSSSPTPISPRLICRRAEEPAGDFRALAADHGFARAIGAVVARVNQGLSPVERVRRFVIAAEPFTIANGQMTPTLKIKRHVIRDAYGAALDALYESKDIAA